jgi:dTDP-4-amino-4,6-dideoxygalactose transaminase
MIIRRYNFPAQFGANESAKDLEVLLKRIKQVLLDGDYILSTDVSAFESSFAQYLGTDHVRGVNSGTDALIIALLALQIGRGDEVITQANTFNATVAAICAVGATPVLVDVEPKGYTLDTLQLAAAVTSRTKAIIPVHLYGFSAPMSSVLDVAASSGLWIIEDAAQAVGACWRGRRLGTIGHIGCFSFHPSKNLAAAGDAGAVVTRDEGIDEKLRQRRELGQIGQNNHVVVGLNSKVDAIQALVLSMKLRYLDGWNVQRQLIAAEYRARLCDLPVTFQKETVDGSSVYHLFQLRTERRDLLLDHLRSDGIDAVVRYPVPIHMQKAFEHCGWTEGQFPIAERLGRELLCLPIRPDMSTDEIEIVSASVHSFFGRTT